MMMNGNSHYHHHHHHHESFTESLLDKFSNDGARSNSDSYATITASPSPINSVNSSPSRSFASCAGANYIEHRVSKMDTVAGIAIKYGVEVADIRRMNGLVTDLQMFALDVLKIPLPGRHPPSPIVLNGSIANGVRTPPRPPHADVLDSLQSLKSKPPRRVTPAMNSLQGYYGLAPPKRGLLAEGTEMAVYRSGRRLSLQNVSPTRESPATDAGFSLHRKSRSLVSLEKAEMIDNEDRTVAEAGDGSEADKSIRRRQKPDNDPTSQTPEFLMKEDSGGGFLGRIRKGLALRPKIGNRMDGDAMQNSPSIGDFLTDVFISMRKSSSTSNLQEPEGNGFIWPTNMWSLKPDAIAKPMTVRRKAALD